MRTREEHLNWCKERALEYLERGDCDNAIVSMMSDMSQHEELKDHAGIRIGTQFLLAGLLMEPAKVRGWIEGFK
jgi:hypothetical protein